MVAFIMVMLCKRLATNYLQSALLMAACAPPD